MRKLWNGLLAITMLSGFGGAAMAHEVKIWVPTPVTAQAPTAPAVANKVKLVNVVVVSANHGRYRGRDWQHGYRSSGFTRVYSGPLYPF